MKCRIGRGGARGDEVKRTEDQDECSLNPADQDLAVPAQVGQRPFDSDRQFYFEFDPPLSELTEDGWTLNRELRY